MTDDGKLELPSDLVSELPRGEYLRVIILVPDVVDPARDAMWNQMTTEQFAAGYAESDAIYDSV